MSLQTQSNHPIPEETQRVARAAFPKGNLYMRMRDELGAIYLDEPFSQLFPNRGQPAESPGRLAWVTVLQFSEGLSDRQAAEAVRAQPDSSLVVPTSDRSRPRLAFVQFPASSFGLTTVPVMMSQFPATPGKTWGWGPKRPSVNWIRSQRLP